MRCLLLALTFASSISMVSYAEDRFAVIEHGNTTIRVDTQSGRVSFCKNENGKPVCKIAADERTAWMAEVEGLEQRVDELQKQVAALEKSSSGSGGKPSGKNDEELDKALETAETMMRRFFGILKDLKNDMEGN